MFALVHLNSASRNLIIIYARTKVHAFILDDLQSKIDALKCLQKETAAELDALMPSILDRAFRGDL